MFYSSRTGPDKYLPWKMGGLFIGVALVLTGARLERRWMIWTGIGILAIAFLLRFLPQGSRSSDDDSGPTPPVPSP